MTRKLTKLERNQARHLLQVLSEQALTVRNAMEPETGVHTVTDHGWQAQWAALTADLDLFTAQVCPHSREIDKCCKGDSCTCDKSTCTCWCYGCTCKGGQHRSLRALGSGVKLLNHARGTDRLTKAQAPVTGSWAFACTPPMRRQAVANLLSSVRTRADRGETWKIPPCGVPILAVRITMKMRRARRAILPVAASVSATLAVPVAAHPAIASPASPESPVHPSTALAWRHPGVRVTAHAEALYALMRVQRGQTMSGIAAARCGSAADWTGIFAASRALHLTGPDPNLIRVGQLLALSCRWVPSMSSRAGAAVVARHYTVTGYAHHDRWDGQHNACGDGDGDGYDMPCSYLHGGGGTYTRTVSYAARPSGGYTARSYGMSTYHGTSGCQAVIIRDESGGNARAVNPSSGAGGLYQFLPSTWHALGHSGLPENASIAEQNQAYYQQVAISGYTAWDASGGCRLWWALSAGAGDGPQ